MNKNTDDIFLLSGKDAQAEGQPTKDGFVVYAGAIARKEIVPSGADSVTPVRTRLLSEGMLEDDGERLRFTKDYTFDSPKMCSRSHDAEHYDDLCVTSGP